MQMGQLVTPASGVDTISDKGAALMDILGRDVSTVYGEIGLEALAITIAAALEA